MDKLNLNLNELADGAIKEKLTKELAQLPITFLILILIRAKHEKLPLRLTLSLTIAESLSLQPMSKQR